MKVYLPFQGSISRHMVNISYLIISVWALWLAALSSLRATGKKVRMCRMGENLGAGWARLGLGSRDDWAPGRKGCRPATGRTEEGAGAQG